MKQHSGFTLIELVIVIIILGVLSATALPKFINLQEDARTASYAALQEAINSAINTANLKNVVEGKDTINTSVSVIGGVNVTFWYGYPYSNKVTLDALIDLSNFTSFNHSTGSLSGVTFLHSDYKDTGDTCIKYKVNGPGTIRYTIEVGVLIQDIADSATMAYCRV